MSFTTSSGSSPRGRGTLFARRHCDPVGRPVHPRAGGEHASRGGNLHAGASDGSSPRGRGTRTPHRRPSIRSRFIPARAGNTSRRSSLPSNGPSVHPRAGGEHSERSEAAGSRLRFIPARAGNTTWGTRRLIPCRFIPARAGNTPKQAICPCADSSTVHPRAGGEHARGRP